MPARQPVQRHLVGVLAQVLGGFHGGQGVQIHDAVDAVVFILQRDIILDRAQVIAQVLAPGGAGAGKNTAFLLVMCCLSCKNFRTSSDHLARLGVAPVCSFE